MEVTALTSLLSSAEATADPGEQTAGGTGFGKILGKALGTKQNGQTEQKKTGQQEKTEDDDLPEQTAVQLAALLLPIAVGAQTAPAGTTAAGSQTGQESSAAALSPLQPAAQELFPTQGAAVAADQFVANVMEQIDQLGQETQSELTALLSDELSQTAPSTAASEAPAAAQTAAAGAASAPAASGETAQVQEAEQQMPVPPAKGQTEFSDSPRKTSGEGQGAQESADRVSAAVSAAPTRAPETFQSRPDGGNTDGDSAGRETGVSTEKSKLRPEEKTESTQTVSAYAEMAAAKGSREAELTQLSEAVDKAMNQFQTDFQSVKTDGSTVRIALEPKELGSISITLSAGLNGVTAKIQTDNKDAASLISNQVQKMVQAMEAKGVRVDSVEIGYHQFSQQSFGGSGGQYQERTPAFTPLRVATRQESTPSAGYESLTEQYAPADGVGQRLECRV